MSGAPGSDEQEFGDAAHPGRACPLGRGPGRQTAGSWVVGPSRGCESGQGPWEERQSGRGLGRTGAGAPRTEKEGEQGPKGGRAHWALGPEPGVQRRADHAGGCGRPGLRDAGGTEWRVQGACGWHEHAGRGHVEPRGTHAELRLNSEHPGRASAVPSLGPVTLTGLPQ